MVLRGKKIAEECAIPGKDLHRHAVAQDRRERRSREMDRLANDEAIQIPQRDFAEDFFAIGVFVPTTDFQALTFEVNADIGLIDDGGRHDRTI